MNQSVRILHRPPFSIIVEITEDLFPLVHPYADLLRVSLELFIRIARGIEFTGPVTAEIDNF